MATSHQTNGLPKHEVDILVDRAAKLFIYAATVCEYVTSGGDMQLRLTEVTKVSTRNLDSKTDLLDDLYGLILKGVCGSEGTSNSRSSSCGDRRLQPFFNP